MPAMQHDPQTLVGRFVTEVGIRQAWPFLTFHDSSDTSPTAELRVYIGTACEVEPNPSCTIDLPSDDPGSTMPALLEVLNLTVSSVTVYDADLVLAFDGGPTLLISGTARRWTTGDVWWLGDPHATCQMTTSV
jgi:hypothetical protein